MDRHIQITSTLKKFLYICVIYQIQMKKLLIVIITLLAGLISASAQSSYEHRQFTSTTGLTLKYRELTPVKTEARKKYPLVIFLHGSGERGDDNEKQLQHGGQMFLNPANQEKYPAYVLFPQCPQDSYWAFGKRPTFVNPMPFIEDTPEITATLKELILSYITNHAVDPSRVYMIGLSMGGMGTYDMVSRFPELFAAAVPICGAAVLERLPAAKNVKFRIFHGDADNVVPVECSRAAYRVLKEAGANVEYHEFAGCGHGSWNPAFNHPDFMKWLFKQKNRKSRSTNQ